jgi:hypothetical protein
MRGRRWCSSENCLRDQCCSVNSSVHDESTKSDYSNESGRSEDSSAESGIFSLRYNYGTAAIRAKATK